MVFLSNKDTYLLSELGSINKIFKVTIQCLETKLSYVKSNFFFKIKRSNKASTASKLLGV